MARFSSARAPVVATTLGLALIAGYLWLMIGVASETSYQAWSAMFLVPLILLAHVPLLRRAGRRDPAPWFLRILVLAFVAKLVASVLRWLMSFVLYSGSDAGIYNKEGARLAEAYRQGNFGADIGRDFIGTGFMRVITGAVYTVTGPTFYVIWLLFALLGFWGAYFLYRAFRVAVPEGDPKRYAVLLLFLPSILFWPAGLGKEAFLTFGIGLFSYGAALLLAGYRTWAVPLLLGVLATGVVRPHITAALFTALVLAWFLRRRTTPANELTPVTYIGGALAILLAGGLVASSAAAFLGVDLSVEGIDSAISDTSDLTANGNSTFTPAAVRNPLDLPFAAFTVLFRPTVLEATSAQMLVAAAEGTALFVLLLVSWRSVLTGLRTLRRRPYLIFCVVYLLVFVYAFSNFGNFGILTRQRVQVLPFLLVFLALKPPRPQLEPDSKTSLREERALT